MKKQTKAVILSIALCMIVALGVFCVFAVKNFSLVSGGSIKFIAPGINATISNATLTGISKKTGSGEMSEFTVTSAMTVEQIEELDGYKSWSGLKLLFDDEAEGSASISFKITNNSSKSNENIMVELSTNTTNESPINTIPSADFCLGAKQSHTFKIDLNVADLTNSAKLNDFNLTVNLYIIKSSEVMSTTEQQQTNGFAFTTSSSARTAILTNCSKSSLQTIEIPAVIKDDYDRLYTVTTIKGTSTSANPFYSSKSTLTNVVLPSTITTIGDYAFYYCSKLTGDLPIPKSVTTIGRSAFYYCKGFTGDLIIPNGVKTISREAFKYSGFKGNLILPNTVTKIDSEAFYFCSGLTGDIIIPNSVQTIGNSAFSDCSGFTGDLIIGDGVTTLDNFAFSDCSGLTGKLSVGASLTTIGSKVFENIGGLSAIEVDSANTAFMSVSDCLIEKSTKTLIRACSHSTISQDENILTKIGDYAFSKTNFGGNLKITSNIKEVGVCAFERTKITGLAFEDGVEVIGDYAFRSCSSLSGDLFIPKSVTSLSKKIFERTKILFDSIVVDSANENYYSVGNCLISKQDKVLIKGCSNSSIPANEGILEIADYAFYYCDSVVSFTIPNTVKIIGNSAFEECDKIPGILKIPDSVTSIGGNTFAWCYGFTQLIIGTGLEKIGTKAFTQCSGITSVVIKSEKEMEFGDALFQYSAKIRTLTLYTSTPPTIVFSTFEPLESMSGLTAIYVPSASVEAYKSANYWSTLASKIQAI